jgi:hypothetical protein
MGVWLMALTPDMCAGAAPTRPDVTPLLNRYAIYHVTDSATAGREVGEYQLVEVMPPTPGVGLSRVVLVRHLHAVGVEQGIIFGRSADGYFSVDTRDAAILNVNTFSDVDSWRAALRGLGIARSEELSAPGALVATAINRSTPMAAPFAQIHIAAVLVQLTGITLSFVIGWLRRRHWMLAAAWVGLVVNVVANVLIEGGGPGAFVGFVLLPMVCLAVAFGGAGVGRFLNGGLTIWAGERDRIRRQ